MGDDEQETEVAEYLAIAEDDDDDAEQAMDWADRHPREVAADTGEADDEPAESAAIHETREGS